MPQFLPAIADKAAIESVRKKLAEAEGSLDAIQARLVQPVGELAEEQQRHKTTSE
ncbi:MAG: hypothetical protein JAY74_14180 [Candidatus Thiodiazotropha taylori]|nr:hypothetical protein [Candidatus Thiodiazotropha taylori]